MINFDKGYCYPSREQIRKKFLIHTGIEKSIRSIDYYTRKLEDLGYINRTRRNPVTENGKCKFKTTLYFITSKAMKHIYKTAAKLCRIAGKFFDKGYNRKKKEAKRYLPFDRDEERQSTYQDFVKFKESLKEVIER